MGPAVCMGATPVERADEAADDAAEEAPPAAEETRELKDMTAEEPEE
jgi:hypothetical protein